MERLMLMHKVLEIKWMGVNRKIEIVLIRVPIESSHLETLLVIKYELIRGTNKWDNRRPQ